MTWHLVVIYWAESRHSGSRYRGLDEELVHTAHVVANWCADFSTGKFVNGFLVMLDGVPASHVARKEER